MAYESPLTIAEVVKDISANKLKLRTLLNPIFSV